MCSRTQYKHNVHAAAQCVEVSWTSAFLLPRALTDVLFLLFVPSALRGVQHVTICTFQFCKKAGTCPLVLGPKNWDGLGSAGGGLPSTCRPPYFCACMHAHPRTFMFAQVYNVQTHACLGTPSKRLHVCFVPFKPPSSPPFKPPPLKGGLKGA